MFEILLLPKQDGIGLGEPAFCFIDFSFECGVVDRTLVDIEQGHIIKRNLMKKNDELHQQSGGDTIIESGGTISATTFKATGGTVTVNGTLDPTAGTLDPTAVEIGSGATLKGTGKIVGNVAMSGTMIPGGPGAPGTLTIFGNYEQIGIDASGR